MKVCCSAEGTAQQLHVVFPGRCVRQTQHLGHNWKFRASTRRAGCNTPAAAGPGGQLGERKHVEGQGRGAGGRVGEDSLDMHFPKLFSVLSTSARYSRQNIYTEAVDSTRFYFVFRIRSQSPKFLF